MARDRSDGDAWLNRAGSASSIGASRASRLSRPVVPSRASSRSCAPAGVAPCASLASASADCLECIVPLVSLTSCRSESARAHTERSSARAPRSRIERASEDSAAHCGECDIIDDRRRSSLTCRAGFGSTTLESRTCSIAADSSEAACARAAPTMSAMLLSHGPIFARTDPSLGAPPANASCMHRNLPTSSAITLCACPARPPSKRRKHSHMDLEFGSLPSVRSSTQASSWAAGSSGAELLPPRARSYSPVMAASLCTRFRSKVSTARVRCSRTFEGRRAPCLPSTSRNASSGSHASSIASTRSWAVVVGESFAGAKPSTSQRAASCASTNRLWAFVDVVDAPAEPLKPPRKRGVPRPPLVPLSPLAATRASSSPAEMLWPSEAFHEMTPLALVSSGMHIFMTSTSAKGVPSTTSSPSAARQRTRRPFDGATNTDGSFSLASRQRLPSMIRRVPAGSSCAYTTWLASSRRTSSPPSRSRCASTCTCWRSSEVCVETEGAKWRGEASSFPAAAAAAAVGLVGSAPVLLASPVPGTRLIVHLSGPFCDTRMLTLNPPITISCSYTVREMPSGGICPRARKAAHSVWRAEESLSDR